VENEKQHIKDTVKDFIAIAFIWLLVIFILYIIYLKIKLLHFN